MTTVVQTGFTPQATLATTVSVTLGATPTPGNLLIAILAVGGTVTSPVYPWSGTPDVSIAGAGLGASHILSKIAGASESTTISYSSATSRQLSLAVVEVAASAGKVWAAFDQSSTNTAATVTSLTVGPTPTQSQADDFAVAGFSLNGAFGGTPTLSDGYTAIPTIDPLSRGVAGYKILSSNAATQTTATWVTARTGTGAVATYAQTAPPSATATLGVIASGSATVSESGAASRSIGIGITGAATVTESATATQTIGIGITGAATVTESATATQTVGIGITGAASVTKSVAAGRPVGISIVASASVSVPATAAGTLALGINITADALVSQPASPPPPERTPLIVATNRIYAIRASSRVIGFRP